MSPTANLRFDQQGFTLDPTGAAAPVPCSGAVAPETPLLMLIPKRLRLANGWKRKSFVENGRVGARRPLNRASFSLRSTPNRLRLADRKREKAEERQSKGARRPLNRGQVRCAHSPYRLRLADRKRERAEERQSKGARRPLNRASSSLRSPS